MKKYKRIHQLPEIIEYDFNHSIIVDKPNAESSNMIKLGNLVELVLTYQTAGKPIIVDNDVTNVITLGNLVTFEPEVSGSNLFFELENNPDFMTIDEFNGVITVEPNNVGNFNNIVLKVSNLYGETTDIFNLKILNRLPKSTKRVDYLSPNRVKRIKNNDEYFVKVMKNYFNKVAYNTTFSKPRIITNESNYRSLYFDGLDDSLICNNNMNDKMVKSLFISFKPDLNRKNYFPLVGDYSNGTQVALDNRKGVNGLSFNGNSTNVAKFSINGSELSDYYGDVNEDVFIDDEWNYLYVEYENTYTTKNINIGTSFPHFSNGIHMYRGYMGGIVLFNSSLNDEEIKEHHNYLKSKYNHD